MDQSTAPQKKERIIPIVRENTDTDADTVEKVKNVEKVITVEKVNGVEKTIITSHDERLIPIVVEKTTLNGERILPVTRDVNTTHLKSVTTRTPRSPVKPALPAKPLSPTRPSRASHPLTSPPLIDSTVKKYLPLQQRHDEDRVMTVHRDDDDRVITVVKVEKVEDPSIPEKVIIEEILTPGLFKEIKGHSQIT